MEIEGFISDRLQEALWREALWLLHDKVATADEIDTAIAIIENVAKPQHGDTGEPCSTTIASIEAILQHSERS